MISREQLAAWLPDLSPEQLDKLLASIASKLEGIKRTNQEALLDIFTELMTAWIACEAAKYAVARGKK